MLSLIKINCAWLCYTTVKITLTSKCHCAFKMPLYSIQNATVQHSKSTVQHENATQYSKCHYNFTSTSKYRKFIMLIHHHQHCQLNKLPHPFCRVVIHLLEITEQLNLTEYSIHYCRERMYQRHTLLKSWTQSLDLQVQINFNRHMNCSSDRQHLEMKTSYGICCYIEIEVYSCWLSSLFRLLLYCYLLSSSIVFNI